MTVKGTIANIVFRNETNGYTIVSVETEKSLITAVGVFPPIAAGHYISMDGEFITHPKYGEQFKATSVKLDKPDSLHGMIMFLGSGLIKGIGEKRAAAIVEKFGKDTFNIIEKSPQRLSTVTGISRKMAISIADNYLQVQQSAEILTGLLGYGFTVNLSMKILNRYKGDSIALITTNPYALIGDVEGIGFLRADKVAEKTGIPKDSEYRIRAAVFYILSDVIEKAGNTCFPADKAISEATQILGSIDRARVEEVATKMIYDGLLKEVDCDGLGGLMTRQMFVAENRAANKIVRILQYNNLAAVDVKKEIDRFEKINGVTFHPVQRDAIKSALSSGVAVITGGPGTGKTTIIRCIVRLLGDANQRVRLMAPTGRAAKRLSEATGEDATTVHRALMSSEELAADVVIVDEFSMVDSLLLDRLLGELSDYTRLIVVGDSDQLPSVGAGNVLADMISSGVIPTVRLTHVFRQGDDSKIIVNAHKVNSGQYPDLKNDSKDFFFMKSTEQARTADLVVELVKTKLPNYLKCEPKQIQVLCPIKAGEAGCVNLNKRLRDALIPKGDEIAVGEYAFSVGDKVMHVVNNYNLEWRMGTNSGKGVFNGDIGYVNEVRTQSGQFDVCYEDGRLVTYAGDDRQQLMPAYAITVHKSQGSEYDTVILVAGTGNYMILTRNLLYTAITRAKNMVVIIGSEQAIRGMVDNNYIEKRYSQLSKLLISSYKKTSLLFGKKVIGITEDEREND